MNLNEDLKEREKTSVYNKTINDCITAHLTFLSPAATQTSHDVSERITVCRSGSYFLAVVVTRMRLCPDEC